MGPATGTNPHVGRGTHCFSTSGHRFSLTNPNPASVSPDGPLPADAQTSQPPSLPLPLPPPGLRWRRPMTQGLPEHECECSQVSAALLLLPGVLRSLFSSPGITQEPPSGLGPAPSTFPGGVISSSPISPYPSHVPQTSSTVSYLLKPRLPRTLTSF